MLFEKFCLRNFVHWLDQRHRQCPAMSANCRYCGNVGHFEIMCRKKAYDSRKRPDYSRKPSVHEVSQESVEQVEYFLGNIFTEHEQQQEYDEQQQDYDEQCEIWCEDDDEPQLGSLINFEK